MTIRQDDTAGREKLGLLILMGMVIAALTAIAALMFWTGTISATAATILTTIISGLIYYGNSLVQAVRSYATSATLNNATDKLAASQPLSDGPQPVMVTNPPGQPVPVEQS